MSIRLRLAVAYGLALAATIGITGTLVWLQMSGSLMQSVEATIATQADAVLTSLENQGQSGLQESDIPEPGIWVVLLDKQGGVIDSSVGAPANLPSSPGQFVSGGHTYLARIDRAQDGTVVVTGADLASLQTAEAALARILLGIGLAVGIASLVVGWLLAGRALRPIDQLIADAEGLGADELGRRLDPPVRNDEVGRLTVTLNRMLDRVSEAALRRRLFVAQASHELRTPLAALRAGLDLIDDEHTSLEEYREAVHEARIDALRLGNLAAGLLQLASVGEDNAPLARAPVELRELAQSALRSVAPLAGHSQAKINTAVPDSRVYVDRTRLEQAVVNLLSNAIVHSTGTPVVDLTAEISGTSPYEVLKLSVADRGPGFGDADPSYLFEPFQRGPDTRVAGSGLGLAMVAATARAHGGEFGAFNRPSGGAVVWMAIPDVYASEPDPGGPGLAASSQPTK